MRFSHKQRCIMAISNRKSKESEEKSRRTKLRIQMAPKAKLSLKKEISGTMKEKQGRDSNTNEGSHRRTRLGRVVRSCLASVGAMADTPENYKADHEISPPTEEELFKGCLAAVKATIDYEPEADFEMEAPEDDSSGTEENVDTVAEKSEEIDEVAGKSEENDEIAEKSEEIDVVAERSEETAEKESEEVKREIVELEEGSEKDKSLVTDEGGDVPCGEVIEHSEESEERCKEVGDGKADLRETTTEELAEQTEISVAPEPEAGASEETDETSEEAARADEEKATDGGDEGTDIPLPKAKSPKVELRKTRGRGRKSPVEDSLMNGEASDSEKKLKDAVPKKLGRTKKESESQCSSGGQVGEAEPSSPPRRGRRGLRRISAESKASDTAKEVEMNLVKTEDEQTEAEEGESLSKRRRGRQKKLSPVPDEVEKDVSMVGKSGDEAELPKRKRGRLSRRNSEAVESGDKGDARKDDGKTDSAVVTEEPRLRRGRCRRGMFEEETVKTGTSESDEKLRARDSANTEQPEKEGESSSSLKNPEMETEDGAPVTRGRGRTRMTSATSKASDEAKEVKKIPQKTDDEQTEGEDDQNSSKRRRGRQKKPLLPGEVEDVVKEKSEEETELPKRKRGRTSKAPDPKEDADDSADKEEPEKDEEDNESADEEEVTEEPRLRRGRGRLAGKTPASPKPAKGKKNVLKVALNIRPKAMREQMAEKIEKAESVEVEAPSVPEVESGAPVEEMNEVEDTKEVESEGVAEVPSVEEEIVLQSEESPVFSPKPVKHAPSKADRNSRGSDTDTAEETLDEEENLRLLETSRPKNPPIIVSPITQNRMPIRTVAPKAIVIQENSSKMLDDSRFMAKPTIVITKGNRKRRIDLPEIRKNFMPYQGQPSKVSAIISPAKPEISAVISRPNVTVVSPMIISKPGVTIVSPQTLRNPFPGSSTTIGPSGTKRIVISMPSTDGQKPRFNTPGVTRTIVVPKSTTPTTISTQRILTPATTALPQVRSIRLSTPGTITAPRTITTIAGQKPGTQFRIQASPFRPPGLPGKGVSPVVMRTVPFGPRQPGTVSLSHRPSIIRSGPRIVTMGGPGRTRVISQVPQGALPSNTRIVTVRPGQPGLTHTRPITQGNRVVVSSISSIVPARQITVQATPSPNSFTPNAAKISTPIVTRSPTVINRPKVISQPQIVAPKPIVTQVQRPPILKPTDRKSSRKVAVQPKATPKVEQQPSAAEKLLMEPQMPKANKKPLSKRQKNLRRTETIKTSTRSRRRGTDLQIDYNEDRDTDDRSEEEEEEPAESVEESPIQDPEVEEVEEQQEEESASQEDIPVAVVEVFLSQDEVKLREVHSPTKQDLVELAPEQVAQVEEQPASVEGGGDAPEGFFTTEAGGYVETDGAFAVRTAPPQDCS